MQWFECWFDSPYYHLLYGKRDEKEAGFFIDNLLSKLDLPKHGRCWDLNCGKGRHSIYLNKKGFDVTGTDLSEESIKHALTFENDTLHFFKHDMRGLFYTNYFDAVFNFFTSFGYFKSKHDDDKVFQSVYNSLKPGGVFVMDYFNLNAKIKCSLCTEERAIEGVQFKTQKKIEDSTIYKEIEVKDKGKTFNFREEVRIFTEDELIALGKKAGFKLKKTFGNYALSAYIKDESERLILIFEK